MLNPTCRLSGGYFSARRYRLRRGFRKPWDAWFAYTYAAASGQLDYVYDVETETGWIAGTVGGVYTEELPWSLDCSSTRITKWYFRVLTFEEFISGQRYHFPQKVVDAIAADTAFRRSWQRYTEDVLSPDSLSAQQFMAFYPNASRSEARRYALSVKTRKVKASYYVSKPDHSTGTIGWKRWLAWVMSGIHFHYGPAPTVVYDIAGLDPQVAEELPNRVEGGEPIPIEEPTCSSLEREEPLSLPEAKPEAGDPPVRSRGTFIRGGYDIGRGGVHVDVYRDDETGHEMHYYADGRLCDRTTLKWSRWK